MSFISAVNYGGALTANRYGGSISTIVSFIPANPGEGVPGQLRDDVTGALLYDAVTGAPLVW